MLKTRTGCTFSPLTSANATNRSPTATRTNPGGTLEHVHGLSAFQAFGLFFGYGQRRDVGQRGLYRMHMFERRGTMPQRRQFI